MKRPTLFLDDYHMMRSLEAELLKKRDRAKSDKEIMKYDVWANVLVYMLYHFDLKERN